MDLVLPKFAAHYIPKLLAGAGISMTINDDFLRVVYLSGAFLMQFEHAL
jgi:hypothetical protein